MPSTYTSLHFLVGLKSIRRLDYFLRDLKADSSLWIHQELKKKFEWQKGCAAFTVSPSSIEGVKKYVLNQEKHHAGKTFKQKFIELLEAGGIAYEEKYLW